MTPHEQELSNQVKDMLVPELLPEQYRTKPEVPMWGHCYGAAIALYYVFGGSKAGYALYKSDVECDGCRHYWVVNPDGEIIDPTKEQYEQLGRPAPYASGRRTGFRTPREARVLLKQLLLIPNLGHARAEELK